MIHKISKEQLIAFVKLGENGEVEFKSSIQSYQDVSKVLCAFGNTHGGILIIGVDDQGNIVGNKKDKDHLQKNIVSAVQSVSPQLQVSVQLVDIESTYVAAVIVHKPARSTYYTFKGAIYIRMGSVTYKLEGASMQQFLQDKCILPFDGCIAVGATVKDIDREKIATYLRAREQYDYLNTHSVKDFLVSSDLALMGEIEHITYAGLLLFGTQPQRFLPQAEIKLVHFAGKEAVDILSYKLITGTLADQINESIEFIKSTLTRSFVISDNLQRSEHFTYPLSVLCEGIINAVVHRDYSNPNAIQINIFEDRIEITNPGSFPGDVPQDMFGTISVQRNALLYIYLRNMNYVEGIGSGIPRMKSAMRAAQLADPVFLLMKSFFRTILYNTTRQEVEADKTIENLNKQKKSDIEYIKKHGAITTQTYAKLHGISSSSALKKLRKLISSGKIKKCGTFRNAYYTLVDE